MATMELRGKQRRYLRGLGVNLKPTVFLGKASLSGAVLSQLREALDANELVKVRLLDTVAGDRHEVAEMISEKAPAELVQVLGRTVLLYRPSEESPQIELPE